MNLEAGLAGRFRMVVRNGETGEVTKDTGWFDNLILDAGLERFGTGLILQYCNVGTSNTSPNVSQTTLVSRVGYTSALSDDGSGVTTISGHYTGYTRMKFRFDIGEATGNLSEVGIGWDDAGTLFCRALIVDEDNDPTTITVLSTEVLDVYYELRLRYTLTESAFSISIGGESYSCVLRAADGDTGLPGVGSPNWLGYGMTTGSYVQALAYNGTLGAITGLPSGDSSPGVSDYEAYSSNSKQKVIAATWELTTGNLVGGISAVSFRSPLHAVQISFSPPIPKDETNALGLRFRYSWDRL